MIEAIPGVSALSEKIAASKFVQEVKGVVGEAAEAAGVNKFVTDLTELSDRASLKRLTSVGRRVETAGAEALEAKTVNSAEPKFKCVDMPAACLLGNTAIATTAGFKAIENVKIGDRVESTHLDEHPDGWTETDGVNWHLLTLTMGDPRGDYEIQMLRPVDWIVEHRAYPGRTIELSTARSEHDHAYVVAVAAAPHITPGAGRVVLSTFAHRDTILEIHVAGATAPIESSPSHVFYSVDRREWVSARELRIGEYVRTKTGEAAVTIIDRKPDTYRVFDIEVEGDHAYYIAAAWLLNHNCGKWQSYENRIADEYGGKQAYQSRRYKAIVDGELHEGVADNVVREGNRSVAIEAKYVRNWETSIRNPNSPISLGQRFEKGAEFAAAERSRIILQARKYSDAFSEVIYHSNSQEFIEHYSRVFADHGLHNIRFRLFP